MKIIKEINGWNDLEHTLWSGGADTIKDLTCEEIETVLDILETSLPEENIMTETELNDFFWFERDTIAEWLGYENFDEIMERNKD